jgi:hypothetical protein
VRDRAVVFIREVFDRVADDVRALGEARDEDLYARARRGVVFDAIFEMFIAR